MALAEALARGLPAVSTAVGAAETLVGDHAGVLVPPGDVDALARALSRIIEDRAWRLLCAAGARRVRERLPDWDQAAAAFAAVLSTVHAHG
jgi:glycosyltransferase involved in cell wall biosynthesis